MARIRVAPVDLVVPELVAPRNLAVPGLVAQGSRQRGRYVESAEALPPELADWMIQ